jgi:hypothetical protein
VEIQHYLAGLVAISYPQDARKAVVERLYIALEPLLEGRVLGKPLFLPDPCPIGLFRRRKKCLSIKAPKRTKHGPEDGAYCIVSKIQLILEGV